jgi:putative hydrolase of the HAD superfamily
VTDEKGMQVSSSRFDLVGLDGDDTLWECQRHFDEVTEVFSSIVAPYVATDADVADVLDATERKHLPVFGFGVKAFTLSMIEAAIDVTDGAIPGDEIGRLINEAKRMMTEPVRLIDGVGDAVAALAADHRLVLITKGDLLHQRRKIDSSGLGEYFSLVEIVHDKTPAMYLSILGRHGVTADRFVMAGDSVRSDVVPVAAIGGTAIHVPHHRVWAHEVIDHDHDVITLDNLGQLHATLTNLG